MRENVSDSIKDALVIIDLSHSSSYYRVKFAKAQIHFSSSGFDNSKYEVRLLPQSQGRNRLL